MVFGFTEIMCAGVYYAFYDWRTVYLILTVIPSILGLTLCLGIYETPKFYLSNNNMEQVL